MSIWRFAVTPFFGNGAPAVTQFTDADELPPFRGENPVIPLREGRLDVDLVRDQWKISMGLFSQAVSASALETAHDALKKLFGNPKRRLLERIMEDSSIRAAWAKPMNLQVKRSGPLGMKLTVDFLLASPFFRSTVATSDTQTIDSNPKTYSLTNPGTAEDRSAVITFTGPLSYPKLTNLITDPVTGLAANVWVGYTGALTAGQTVVIDVVAGTCLFNGANALNQLIHSGDTYFMVLKSGANSMKVDSSVTGGTVKVEFYAPYF